MHLYASHITAYQLRSSEHLCRKNSGAQIAISQICGSGARPAEQGLHGAMIAFNGGKILLEVKSDTNQHGSTLIKRFMIYLGTFGFLRRLTVDSPSDISPLESLPSGCVSDPSCSNAGDSVFRGVPGSLKVGDGCFFICSVPESASEPTSAF